jgi:ATP-binding cassette subfamily C protein
VCDLDQIRAFLSSSGPSALADLPWAPVYVAICFLFHPLIGIAAVIGGVVLSLITLCAELFTRAPTKAAAAHHAASNALLEASRRNAEVVRAMGLAPRLGARWAEANANHLKSQRKASDVSGGLSSLSRGLRMLLQSTVLGLGAYLVIYQEASAGVIIASSILVSRALAPVELAVANWKSFVARLPIHLATRRRRSRAVGHGNGRERGGVGGSDDPQFLTSQCPMTSQFPLPRRCLVAALFGHPTCTEKCPLSRGKRT